MHEGMTIYIYIYIYATLYGCIWLYRTTQLHIATQVFLFIELYIDCIWLYMSIWLHIMRSYSFPESFPEDAKALVCSLLVEDPAKRLGSDDTGMATRWCARVCMYVVNRKTDVVSLFLTQFYFLLLSCRYQDLTSHAFFEGVEWIDPPLHAQTPPKVEPYAPAKSSSCWCSGLALVLTMWRWCMFHIAHL
jgi:hypothetical protein